MAYTWEEVMLGIDVRKEASEKADERIAIEEKRRKEEKGMSAWSLVGSILGAVVAGPVGYFIGKQAGKISADIWGPGGDWEKDVALLKEGKFNTKEAQQYKRAKEKEITDQTQGQVISFATDLASLYMMAGGLEAGPGEMDFTTFGAGESEWSVLGKTPTPTIGEQISTVAPGPGGAFRQVDVTPVTFTGRDVTSLKDIYQGSGFKGIGETVKSVGASTLPLDRLIAQTGISE